MGVEQGGGGEHRDISSTVTGVHLCMQYLWIVCRVSHARNWLCASVGLETEHERGTQFFALD